jgi:hypothetical protein
MNRTPVHGDFMDEIFDTIGEYPAVLSLRTYCSTDLPTNNKFKLHFHYYLLPILIKYTIRKIHASSI